MERRARERSRLTSPRRAPTLETDRASGFRPVAERARDEAQVPWSVLPPESLWPQRFPSAGNPRGPLSPADGPSE